MPSEPVAQGVTAPDAKARPDFLYPSQCDNNGWSLAPVAGSFGAQSTDWTDLCADATAVQATDAGAPSSCPDSRPLEDA